MKKKFNSNYFKDDPKEVEKRLEEINYDINHFIGLERGELRERFNNMVGEQMETSINKDLYLSDFYNRLGIDCNPYNTVGYDTMMGYENQGWKWDEANQDYEFGVIEPKVYVIR